MAWTSALNGGTPYGTPVGNYGFVVGASDTYFPNAYFEIIKHPAYNVAGEWILRANHPNPASWGSGTTSEKRMAAKIRTVSGGVYNFVSHQFGESYLWRTDNHIYARVTGDDGMKLNNSRFDTDYATFVLAPGTPAYLKTEELLLDTCVPIPESVHVYLNGVEQYQPQDWTLMAPDGSHASWWVRIEAAMDAQSGDLVEARYVCAVS